MGVNEIDFRGLSASRGLNDGLQIGAALGGMYRRNRLQDDELELRDNQRAIDDAARDAYVARSIEDPAQRQAYLQRRVARIQARGGDPSDTLGLMQLPFEQQTQELDYVVQKALPVSSFAQANENVKTADMQTFEYMTQGLSPKEKEQAMRVHLGLDPRAMGSAAQTIASSGQTDTVAESEATIAGAKAGASEEKRLQQQAKYLPEIRAAIKEAEREAESTGEAMSELKRARVAMPGLLDAVNNLKALAPLATSTMGGRTFDTVVKELGFGATDGATARAKYIAIVDNQVLPLLKQTFGAAFTVKEGESLKATLGDPNASPAEKVAQLDAFIEQKMRDLETKERQVGQQQEKPSSIDDLVNKYAN